MFCGFDCVTLWAPIGIVVLMRRSFAQNIPETRLQSFDSVSAALFCLPYCRRLGLTSAPTSLFPNSPSAHSKSPNVIHIFSRSGSANFRVQRKDTPSRKSSLPHFHRSPVALCSKSALSITRISLELLDSIRPFKIHNLEWRIEAVESDGE